MDEPGLGWAVNVHRFFKGCTRPAMFLSVPLVPFLVATGGLLILAVWAFYLISPYVTLILLMLYLPIYMTMREMTRRDDQRLKQMMMRLRMRFRHSNKTLWGAISYSPLRYKKRSAQ